MGNIPRYGEGVYTWGKRLSLAQHGRNRRFKNEQ